MTLPVICKILGGLRWRAQVLTDWFVHLSFAARIRWKWFLDKRRLPLTNAHWGVYNTIHIHYYKSLGHFPDLVRCPDFNDRIQWLKLFDQDPVQVLLVDKISVRDYVKRKLGEGYLPKLYQVCDRYEEIHFDALPKAFVIKASHDSGSVVLVRDKSSLDGEKAKKKLDAAIKKPFGVEKGEWAYAHVPRRILIEEFIDPHHPTAPPDYKFQCVDGVVKFCRFTWDRDAEGKEVVLDRAGRDLGYVIDEDFIYCAIEIVPPQWERMIAVAELLSDGFKCVRVDLYLSRDHIIIGEMTFWPYGGFYRGEAQKKVGALLDFDRSTIKPPVCVLKESFL